MGDFYYDHHGCYSLNAQVVCDANWWIIFLFLGYTGNETCPTITHIYMINSCSFFKLGQCHDHYVFCNSDLWINRDAYFSQGEYLIADSAYPISVNTIVAIKAFNGIPLMQDQVNFSSCIANACACNEHCIGMLKACWQSLKGLPAKFQEQSNVRDLTRVLEWITTCTVLHNFLVDERDYTIRSMHWTSWNPSHWTSWGLGDPWATAVWMGI